MQEYSSENPRSSTATVGKEGRVLSREFYGGVTLDNTAPVIVGMGTIE